EHYILVHWESKDYWKFRSLIQRALYSSSRGPVGYWRPLLTKVFLERLHVWITSTHTYEHLSTVDYKIKLTSL
ncbi:7394_t:CDS:1, partial [Gigaspora rosea]